jgi:hypothetical protein
VAVGAGLVQKSTANFLQFLILRKFRKFRKFDLLTALLEAAGCWGRAVLALPDAPQGAQQNADKFRACARASSAFACRPRPGLLPSAFGVQ